jgi:protein TonB
MAAALLVVGSSRSAAVSVDDFQTRSRRFLKRGLVLSGALHLALLFAVLWAARGGEEVVRLTAGRVDVIPQIPPGILVPPPPSGGSPAPPPENTGGVIDPTDVKVKLPPFEKVSPVISTTGSGTDHPRPIDGPAPGGTPTEPGEARVFEPGQVDQLPVEIFAPKPRYPDYELEAGITGRVVMKVLVDEEGLVRSVERVSGGRSFGEAARETLYRWRFKPALVHGKPVRVWVEIPVNFVL